MLMRSQRVSSLPGPPKFSVEPSKPTKAERDKAKLLSSVINHHMSDPKNYSEFQEKVSQYMRHYMTCTNPSHWHDVIHTEWADV